MKYVAYYRVSTDEQGRSGLGLEAQQEAVHRYLQGKGWPPMGEFTDVESGRNRKRPQLEAALKKCRLMGATLVVAKIDRLARDAYFTGTILESGVPVVFLDLPDMGEGPVPTFVLQMMASVAQLEAGLISRRTRDALAAAKARGVKLGGDRGYRPPVEASRAAALAHREKARRRAEDFRDVLLEVSGGLRARANEMNRRGIPTPSGKGAWHPATVSRVLKKLEVV